MFARQEREPDHSRLLFLDEEAGKKSLLISTTPDGVPFLRKKGIIFMLEGIFSSRAVIDNVFNALEKARATNNFAVFQQDFPALNYASASFEGTIEESFGVRDERYYRFSYAENFSGKVILETQDSTVGKKVK